MRISPFIFLIFVMFPIWIQAQDTDYIEDRSHQLQVHLYGKQKFTDLNFMDIESNRTLIYSPNDQLNVGLGFNWRFIGLGFAFNFRLINNDDDVYGDTKRLDWQMNLFTKRSVMDLTFFLYRSFYIENPKAVLNAWKEGDPNYIRPDISMAGFGFSHIYVFNHERFSYKAAFLSNAIQKRSAGSFLLGGQFNFGGMASDSSFFPTNSNFSHYASLMAANRNSLGLNLGYAYTLVLPWHTYASLGLNLTPSLLGVSVRLKNKLPDFKLRGGLGSQVRIALGYNGDLYYGGISFISHLYSIRMKRDNLPDISWQNGNLRFFFGRRF